MSKQIKAEGVSSIPMPSSKPGKHEQIPGLGALDDLPGDLAAVITRAGREWSRQFEAQFTARTNETRPYFKLLDLIRKTLHQTCWPEPSPKKSISKSYKKFQAKYGELIDKNKFIESAIKSKKVSLEQICESFVASFQMLQDKRLTRNPEGDVVEVEIPCRRAELDSAWAQAPQMKIMTRLADDLASGSPPGITPFLFGSMAEPGPWPEYADIDWGIYIAPPAMNDPQALAGAIKAYRRAIGLITRVDPLQHHGPFVLLNLERSIFSEAYLPRATLELATTLTGEPLKLTVSPIEDRILSLRSLLNLYRGVRHMTSRPALFRDRYSAKYITSMILLVPALACGCLGRPVDKRASFGIFKNEFAGPAVKFIEPFEQLRLDWQWTLYPPPALLMMVSSRANLVARNWNRWPSAELGSRLAELVVGMEDWFRIVFQRVCRDG